VKGQIASHRYVLLLLLLLLLIIIIIIIIINYYYIYVFEASEAQKTPKILPLKTYVKYVQNVRHTGAVKFTVSLTQCQVHVCLFYNIANNRNPTGLTSL